MPDRKQDLVRVKVPATLRSLSIGPNTYAAKNGVIEVKSQDAERALRRAAALLAAEPTTPTTPPAAAGQEE